MTSVSAGHIILTPTQTVGSGRPQWESNPGPPDQESRALPTELPRPPTFTHTYTHAPTVSVPHHSLTHHTSRSLDDPWGIKDDRATTFLHSSLSSAFQRVSPNSYPVHSDILSSHLFFCLSFLLPPCTVPCRIIFSSPVDLVMCPCHLILRFRRSRRRRRRRIYVFSEVIRSSYGLIVFLTSLFVIWSLYEMPISLWKHLFLYFVSSSLTLL